MREISFTNGEYYHIYNRGVDKRIIFLDNQDYWKFFDDLRDFNNNSAYEERLAVLGVSKDNPKPPSGFDFKALGAFLEQQEKVVDVISYTINPNHFHLIVKQLVDNGISNFMRKVGLGYTNYFNKKNERSGALFQGAYKAIHIDTNDYLLWLLGYVNGNIEIHGLKKADEYSWSSYRAIKKALGGFGLGLEIESKPPSGFSNLSVLSGLEDIILSQFRNEDEFKNFVDQVIAESRLKKEMKKYLLEDL